MPFLFHTLTLKLTSDKRMAELCQSTFFDLSKSFSCVPTKYCSYNAVILLSGLFIVRRSISRNILSFSATERLPAPDTCYPGICCALAWTVARQALVNTPAQAASAAVAGLLAIPSWYIGLHASHQSWPSLDKEKKDVYCVGRHSRQKLRSPLTLLFYFHTFITEWTYSLLKEWEIDLCEPRIDFHWIDGFDLAERQCLPVFARFVFIIIFFF